MIDEKARPLAHNKHPLNGKMFWVAFEADGKKQKFLMLFIGIKYRHPIDQAIMLCREICSNRGMKLKEDSISIRLTPFKPSNYFGAETQTITDDLTTNASEITKIFNLFTFFIRKITEEINKHNEKY